MWQKTYRVPLHGIDVTPAQVTDVWKRHFPEFWPKGNSFFAPLAGIGNWFIRLQAQRYGAGLAVSEMVSSFAVHHGNEKTHHELLRIHPEERLTSVQLFGQDPEVMRSAAAASGALPESR